MNNQALDYLGLFALGAVAIVIIFFTALICSLLWWGISVILGKCK